MGFSKRITFKGNTEYTFDGFLGKLVLVIIIACFYGWGNNAYRLIQADFEPSYKTEIIRTAGIIIVPAGVILGYIDIPDNKEVVKSTQLNK